MLFLLELQQDQSGEGEFILSLYESKDSKTAKKTMKMNSEGRFISDNPKCYKNTVKIMVLE